MHSSLYSALRISHSPFKYPCYYFLVKINFFKLPKNKQGIVIDVLMILAYIFVFPIFASRIEDFFRGSFNNERPSITNVGILMVVVIVCRITGLFLKRYPLQARLRSSHADFSAGFLILSAPVIILSAVGGAGIFPETAGDPAESRPLALLLTISILLLAVVEIFLLFRLGKKLTSIEVTGAAKGRLLYGRFTEFIADTGLFVYMFVWQVVYYGLAAWLLRSPETSQGFDFYIFRIFILAICFAVFYLSPRAVFLAEDRKYASTWLFILAAFISSLLPHWLQQYTGLFF